MTDPKKLRVLIADDHEMVLRGLRMTIEAEADLELAGIARNGKEAVALVESSQPDVVLLDVEMPLMDGIAATQAIRKRHPSLPVLILTSYNTDAQVYQAMQAGASGYLLKDVSGDALLAAIHGAARREPQLHPEIARKLMQRMTPPDDPFRELTARERDVLALLAQGMSNKEIGAKLFLTEVTVKGYVSEILSKLDVADRTQAALLAVKYGFGSG